METLLKGNVEGYTGRPMQMVPVDSFCQKITIFVDNYIKKKDNNTLMYSCLTPSGPRIGSESTLNLTRIMRLQKRMDE